MKTFFIIMGISTLLTFILLIKGEIENNKNIVYEKLQCTYKDAHIIAYSPYEYNVIVSGVINPMSQIYTWAPYPMFSTLDEAIRAKENIDNGSITVPCIHDKVQDIITTLKYNGDIWIVSSQLLVIINVIILNIGSIIDIIYDDDSDVYKIVYYLKTKLLAPPRTISTQ